MTGLLAIAKTSNIVRKIDDYALGESSDKIKYIYDYAQDKNSVSFAGLQIQVQPDGHVRTFISASNKTADGATVQAMLQAKAWPNGQISTEAQHPRPDNYGNDIVTAKALKDFAIQQLTTDRIASIANNTAKLPDGGTWACMGANAANVKICAGGTAPGFVCNAFRVA